MDNAERAIMIGVGLFIVIIIVSAVLLITNMGVGMIKKAQSDVGNLSAQISNDLENTYGSGDTFTGAEVLQTIRRYYSDTKVCVLIVTPNGSTTSYAAIGAGKMTLTTASSGATIDWGDINAPVISPYSLIGESGTEVLYGESANITSKPSISDFTNISKTTYISMEKTYVSSIVKSTKSGAVIGVAFKRKI